MEDADIERHTAKARLSRRNFLLTVGAGGAATAAAVVVAKKSDRSPQNRQRQACDAAIR